MNARIHTTDFFYQHPYGGIARNAYVSKEDFAKFFDHSPDYIEDLPPNVKVFDVVEPWWEILGYIELLNREADLRYRLVFIDRRRDAHTCDLAAELLSERGMTEL